MAMYGADVEQVKRAAHQFDLSADRLEGSANSMGAALRQTPWMGPDALNFNNHWQTQLAPSLRAVALALRDAAEKLRRNALGQEDTSSVGPGSGIPLPNPFGMGDGPRGPHTLPGSIPHDSAGDAEQYGNPFELPSKFLEEKLLGTGISVGDAIGLLPKVGDVPTAFSAIDKIAHGEVPWREALDVVGGTLRSSGNPLAYGIGVNTSLWSDVFELGTRSVADGGIDWSPKGMQDAFKGACSIEGWQQVAHDVGEQLPSMVINAFKFW